MLKIVLADDDLVSLRVLERFLRAHAYHVEMFPDGTSTWNRLMQDPAPDIAILDWHMPGLTGTEICERYAREEQRPFLYRIILSGKMGKEDIIEALHRGAHDVLQKPYDLPLIQSRLQVAAHIIREKKAVEEMANVMQRYGEKMEQLAQERAQQLVHADRMSSLGAMAAGVAHEINNPMSFISGNVQSFQRYWQDIEPILQQHLNANPANNSKVTFILSEMPRVISSIMNGVQRVTAIVKGLKKYSGKTSETFRDEVDLNSCVEQALELCRGSFEKSIVVNKKLCTTLPLLRANPIEIEQVLVNLLVNAAHAMEGEETKILTICSEVTAQGVLILVEDTGTGIPPHLLTKIWDPFVTTKALGKGTGLGLSISKGIVSAHGGEIKASNKPEGGARFEISLPHTIERQTQ